MKKVSLNSTIFLLYLSILFFSIFTYTPSYGAYSWGIQTPCYMQGGTVWSNYICGPYNNPLGVSTGTVGNLCCLTAQGQPAVGEFLSDCVNRPGMSLQMCYNIQCFYAPRSAQNCIGPTDNKCLIVKVGSSANLSSGNMSYSQNIGALTISYNNIDSSVGVIGKGWTHNYNLSIMPMSNGDLYLKGAEGNNIHFTLSSGVYNPDPSSGDTSHIILNSDGTYTQTTLEGIIYSFNSSGKLASITDRNGKTTTLTYSGLDLTSITDANGRTSTLTVTNSIITAIIDPGGNQYTLAYNSGNYLTFITDPTGHSWSYTYDSNGNMINKADPAGFTVSYTYDANGKYLSSTDPEGKTRSLSYNTSNTSTFTEKDGGVWTFQYDPTLKVKTSQTDPLGNTTTYTNDSNGNRISEIDPAGNTTAYTYDANRNMLSEKDSLGNTTTYTYNSNGQVTSKTDPSGNVTTNTYDSKGNLISITDPSGAVTAYQYDSKGNMTSMTDAKGQISKFVYDQYNDLTSMTDPLGATTKYTYDVVGNMTSQTDAQGNVTTFTYNSLNQLISVTDPLGNTSAYTYDADGNKASLKDANGNTTYYAHRYNGQVNQITDALGKITAFSYGTAGCPSCGGGVDKLTAVTDAKSNVTSFQYDTTGHLIKETDPMGYITLYTYDSNGNLATKTDANGNRISYSYDALNRLTERIYPDGSGDAFAYDARGNITYAGNGYIAYNFTYDSLNRPTSVTDSNNRTIQYTYDEDSNRLTLTNPFGSQIQYGYNATNRLSSLQTGQGQFTFTYDTLGRRTGLNYPNTLNNFYAFDAAGRLDSIALQNAAASTIASTSYTYDNAGNRTSATVSPGGYNVMNNLSQGQYSYDSGNRLTDDGIFAYSYNNNGNRITRTEKATGNTTNYTWDAENRLIQVQMPSGSIVQYEYDPFGRRIEKNVNGRITQYLYDNQNILFEYNQNGNVLSAFTHGAGIDEPLMWTSGGTTYFYHADALGSISMISSASGSVIQTNVNDAFGSIQSGNTLSQPYAFTGREYDAETGLYYYRARYYDPLSGRFISKDPIGLNGDNVNLYGYVDSVGKPMNETNLYLYTGDNPVNWTDPEGLFNYKPGVPPAGAVVEAGLRCMDSCLGTDLGISGGGEQSGHSPNSQHYAGNAADISFRMNPGLDKKKVMCCAKKCGFGFAQTEGNHYHVQIPAGGGGSHGDESNCGCDK